MVAVVVVEVLSHNCICCFKGYWLAVPCSNQAYKQVNFKALT